MTPEPTTSDLPPAAPPAPAAADGANPSLHDHLRETVRQTERRFQVITDNAMDLLAVVDANGVYTFVSGAYERILGNRPDELVGTPSCFAHLHPDDHGPVRTAIDWVLAEPGRAASAIYRLRRADGQYRTFEGRGRNLLHDPAVAGVVVSSRDITDQKAAEAQLRASEERALTAERWFRQMIDSATDLLALIDANQNFTYISGAWERHLAWRPDEMLGKPAIAHVHPDDLPLVAERLGRVLATPGAEETVTFRYRGKDATYRWFEARGRNRLDDPAIRAVVVNSRDVTQQKAVEEELKHARTAAEAAARAKSEFLANISHELRTPLNGVLGYVQILHADPSLTDHQKECLDAIESCGEQLLALINDVLDLSKIEAGRLQVSTDACDLRQTVYAVANVVRPRAEAKGLRFAIDVDPDLPAAVCTDERKLRQVLINLLGNAVKFTPAGGVRMDVEMSEMQNDECRMQNGKPADGAASSIQHSSFSIHHSPHISFSVTDTGVGVEPSQMRDIFDPFKQTKVGIREEGTGLGLAISRRLVEAMGGRLEVESEVGRGSRFYFSIPLVAVDGPAADGRDAAGASRRQWMLVPDPNRPPPAVLVVDDRPTNRQILARMLRNAGFGVHEATNGVEALAALRRQREAGAGVALVLMDVLMPVMDGLEATRRIRADAALSAVKVIAVTASVFPEARQRMAAAGFDDIVDKPLRAEELFARIEQHLGPGLVRYVDDAPPDAAGPPEAGTAAVGPPALPPAEAARVARRLREAVEIGDVTALAAVAGELAAAGGAAAGVGREVGRLARELDFDGVKRLAVALAADKANSGAGV